MLFLLSAPFGFQGSLRVASPVAWVRTRPQPDYGMHTGVLQKRESGGRLLGAEAYLAMELGNLVSAPSECKMVCRGWNTTRCQNKKRIEMGGGWMAGARAYSLCRLCKSGGQLLRRNTPRPVLRSWLACASSTEGAEFVLDAGHWRRWKWKAGLG
jgi:hypothetical protein